MWTKLRKVSIYRKDQISDRVADSYHDCSIYINDRFYIVKFKEEGRTICYRYKLDLIMIVKEEYEV